jgi:hypothetical protein
MFDRRQISNAAICGSGSPIRKIVCRSSDVGGRLMPLSTKIVLVGAAALAVAGAAVAATPAKHVMNVSLPDGSTAHIEYVGDVAPKVTIAPGPFAPFSIGWEPMAIPDFSRIDRIMADMERQRAAILQQVQQMPHHGIGIPTATIASYGNIPSLPAGANSISVVSVSNGGATCTRTTRVTSEGPGKAPKVESSVSGNCSASAAPVPQAKPTAAPRSSAPVDHT